jgi:hypothetical protein
VCGGSHGGAFASSASSGDSPLPAASAAGGSGPHPARSSSNPAKPSNSRSAFGRSDPLRQRASSSGSSSLMGLRHNLECGARVKARSCEAGGGLPEGRSGCASSSSSEGASVDAGDPSFLAPNSLKPSPRSSFGASATPLSRGRTMTGPASSLRLGSPERGGGSFEGDVVIALGGKRLASLLSFPEADFEGAWGHAGGGEAGWWGSGAAAPASCAAAASKDFIWSRVKMDFTRLPCKATPKTSLLPASAAWHCLSLLPSFALARSGMAALPARFTHAASVQSSPSRLPATQPLLRARWSTKRMQRPSGRVKQQKACRKSAGLFQRLPRKFLQL